MIEQEGPTTASDAVASELGVNAWLVEENYQEFLTNPSSVSESWRAYFAGEVTQPAAKISTSEIAAVASPPVLTNGAYASNGANGALPAVALGAAPTTPPTKVAELSLKPPATAPVTSDEEVTPLRGAAARIVENMVASLSVPTATSVHPTPAKVLEVNRIIINDYLSKTKGKKISFTHLIAYALVKAVELVPSMNATFVEDYDGKGTPGVIRHEHVGLGIAIDIERANGRLLLVPAIKLADTFDFAGFVNAYEELVAKARNNKLAVEDFSGVTMTITNPGTLGTTQSVPRLMRGQGAIIGVGALDFPVEYRATDPEILASLGVGKVVTLTSTYDHRIIQGAESGLFLKYVDEFLVGSRGFYENVFSSLGVPGTPVHLTRDSGEVGAKDTGVVSNKKQLAVASLIEAYRVHGHRIATINPIAATEAEVPEELDLATYGLSAWDLDRVFLCPDLGDKSSATLREILGILRSAYCTTITVEYRHIQRGDEVRWISHQAETRSAPLSPEEQRYILERLNEAETFETFLHSRYVGQKRFGLEGGTSAIPFIDTVLLASAQGGVGEAVLGMSHRGRLNVLANVIGKPASEIFADFEQNLDPLSTDGSGDMKYHKGGTGVWTGLDGHAIPVSLVP
ncbi:MAG TPA: 2-oxo acid dehydrogenase subunit E2, partial [Acidimicrobiales bacterium]|nr:2-oxo acid dehydrogenase subunit E2 [Acidimicrobiales bacterium]